jgi:hypothetical protein
VKKKNFILKNLPGDCIISHAISIVFMKEFIIIIRCHGHVHYHVVATEVIRAMKKEKQGKDFKEIAHSYM